MRSVRIWVDLSDSDYDGYVYEAKRRDVTVEDLIQQMVQGLIRELKRDEQEGTDHLIIPA